MPTNLTSRLCVFALLLFSSNVSAQSEQKPATHVQIVNATSVPSVSVEVNGEMLYPEFSQGKKTSGGATPRLNARYKVTDLKSNRSAEASFIYSPDTYYTLLITGDFSTDSSPQTLPQPAEVSPEKKQEFKPNVQFRLIENEPLEAGRKPRYRFVNAVPRKTMSLDKKEASPSAELVLEEQAFFANYTAEFGTQRISVVMNQEGIARNCTIVFYQSEKGIKFVRAFENSHLSEQARAALE